MHYIRLNKSFISNTNYVNVTSTTLLTRIINIYSSLITYDAIYLHNLHAYVICV